MAPALQAGQRRCMQPVSPIPHLPARTAAPRPRQAVPSGAFARDLQRAAAGLRRVTRPVQRPTAPRGLALPGRAARFEPGRARRFSETVPTLGALRMSARGLRAGEMDPAKAALVDRIHAVAYSLGVEPRLAEAVARAESDLDQTARSPDGQSVGAFQMKAPTRTEMQRRFAREGVGVSLADEVTLGVGYLDYLDGVFARRAVLDEGGRTTTAVPDDAERRRFAIAAYNAGEGRVAAAQRATGAAGGDPRRFEHVRPFLPPITQRYVERVLALATDGPQARPAR